MAPDATVETIAAYESGYAAAKVDMEPELTRLRNVEKVARALQEVAMRTSIDIPASLKAETEAVTRFTMCMEAIDATH
jgi:hypothetical protein